MTIISLQFVFFVAALLAAYQLAATFAPKHQWLVILAANLVFYCLAGSWQMLAFILVAAGCSWGVSQRMAAVDAQAKAARKATRDRRERKQIKASATKRKRRLMLAALLVCLGVLGYLKYWNTLLFNLGLAASTNSLGIVLPLGISFYTFQSVGYVIDVYNGKVMPEKNFARYLTFVSFFPQMIQGPINQYGELAPQMFEPRALSKAQLGRGAWLAWFGLFKKIVIANVLAGKVSTIFAQVNSGIPGSVVVLGVVTYSIQMYADFSGGIDIARGVSEMLGIKMALNFRQPYLSTSLSDFWRRWHMSLGAFMKDYVFYPLALTRPMQRFGKWGQAHLGRHLGRTLPACVANIIVFVLVGLWHGAELHYLVWGFVNGAIIALSDLFAPAFRWLGELLHINRESKGFHLFAIVRTFAVVCFVRYFDVVSDPMDAFICLHNTVFNFMPIPYKTALSFMGVDGVELFGLSRVALIGCLLVLVVSVLEERGYDVRELLAAKALPIKVLIVAAMFALILMTIPYGVSANTGFAYANF